MKDAETYPGTIKGAQRKKNHAETDRTTRNPAKNREIQRDRGQQQERINFNHQNTSHHVHFVSNVHSVAIKGNPYDRTA